MGAIFISYRRIDSQDIVGRIHDRLSAHFQDTTIFLDLDSIPPGKDFQSAIQEAFSLTNVGLIIIGQRWLSLKNEQGIRRLDDPTDFVRREIEYLLASSIPVIPCLVGQASMPEAEAIPEVIRPLAYRQSVSIRPDPDFHRDMDRLIARLDQFEELPTFAELVFVREVGTWWGTRMECNTWLVMSGNSPVLSLTGEETVGSSKVRSGLHKIWVEWHEHQRSTYLPQSTIPGHYSSGQTEPIEIDLRPNTRGVFTLVSEPDRRSWWRQFLDNGADTLPRSIRPVPWETLG